MMKNEIPCIARMMLIRESNFEEKKIQQDKTYFRFERDTDCEYCQNTETWD